MCNTFLFLYVCVLCLWVELNLVYLYHLPWLTITSLLLMKFGIPPPSIIDLCFISNYLFRDKTFRNAEVRQDDMYFDWPDQNEEHATQFYPAFKMFRYPKKYRVNTIDYIILFYK